MGLIFVNLVFPRWKKLGFCPPIGQRWQLGLDNKIKRDKGQRETRPTKHKYQKSQRDQNREHIH